MVSTRDWLIATLMGENNRGTVESQQGVLDTIINRLASPTEYGAARGANVQGIVTARTPTGGYQYDAWRPELNGKANGQYALSSAALKGRDALSGAAQKQYDQAARVVDDFMDKGIGRGVTQGATFYQTPDAPNAWQRNSLWPKYGSVTVGDHIYSGPALVKDRAEYQRQNPSLFTSQQAPAFTQDGFGAIVDPSKGYNGGGAANFGDLAGLFQTLPYGTSPNYGPGDALGVGDGSLTAGLLPDVFLSRPNDYGNIASLYQHDVGRSPDADGANYWIKQLDSGKSLFDIEQGIRNSSESQAYLAANPRDFLAGLLSPPPGPLNGGNFNLPSAPGVNTGNSFPTSPLQGGNYNIDPLSPVNPGNPFQTPGLNGGNYNLPNVPMPGTPIQPVGPGAETSPVGPGSETSPVAPGGATGAVGPGGLTSAVGPGAAQSPVGPGGMTSPVTPGETSAFVPPETQAVAPPDAIPAFSAQAYLAANPDVQASGVDPLTHFLRYGYGEGRAIDASGDRLPQGFDANAYLAANPDVARAGMNPLEHFARYGVAEGRSLSPTGFSNANVSGGVGNGTFASTFNPNQYLAANPDVAASGMDPLAHFVKYGLSEGRAVDTAGDRLPVNFDGNAYLAQNQDVARSGMSPLEHYLRYGAAEGRAAPTGANPYSFTAANVSQGLGPTGNGTFAGTFNPSEYFAQNKDVAASGMSALDHYLQYGFNEGRAIDTRGDRINQGFDPLQYLNLNQDVKAAGMDPLRHYLLNGASEGRALPTGSNHYSFTNFNPSQGLGPTGNGVFGLGGIGSTAPAPAAMPTLPQFGAGFNVSSNVPNGSFSLAGISSGGNGGAGISSPYGFSNANVAGALGAGPQSFGSYYPVGDAPSSSGSGNVFDPFGFSGANVGGYDPNAGGGSPPAAPAPVADTGALGYNSLAGERSYLQGQALQNNQQIIAGQSPFATNPNLWGANQLQQTNASLQQAFAPVQITPYSNAQQAALNTFTPPPILMAPVMPAGPIINPIAGSTFHLGGW